MDFEEILAMFCPKALLESVNLMKGTEPLLLTNRLRKNEVNSLDEICVFEVEEGSYNLAPMGYSGDPASKFSYRMLEEKKKCRGNSENLKIGLDMC